MNKYHNRVAIIGIVGVPGKYGGFETLAENLINQKEDSIFDVYCSYGYKYEHSSYKGANLHYIPIKANGFQSIFYDIISIIDAIFKGYKNLLILGVSGAIILPIIKFLRIDCYVVTNIDGLEWKRDKWGKYAKKFLKFSEKLSIFYSDKIIADNSYIQKYLIDEYKKHSYLISYGGDHVKIKEDIKIDDYALALCRIEPENNIEIILQSFSDSKEKIIFVGNWNNSNYGKKLLKQFTTSNIILLDPIYNEDDLCNIRSRCLYYVHGHSAGGTNPSLVEMMFYGKPIIAFDCGYNRATLNNLGNYFTSSDDLIREINQIKTDGEKIKIFANKTYTWEQIVEKYRSLFDRIHK